MTARFGAFGKMPSLGDFFRIDLAQGFVDPWDRWLQEGIVLARGALGPRWQDRYFSAPIWRFSLSPGLAGAAAVIGVMMMSVDRVGRQFPLTLASPLPDGTDPVLDHLSAGRTYAALEALALDALEDTMTREALAARLGQIEPSPSEATHATVRRERGGMVVLASAEFTSALAAEALRATARRPSLWSTEIDGETRLMVCDGLPAGGQLVGLFDMGARVWTGRDTDDDDIPVPVPPVPPVPDTLLLEPSPDGVALRAAKPAAPPPAEHVPLEDPLADILLPDEPAMDLADHGDDDPLAAILSGGDPVDDPAPDPGAVQEA